MTRGEVQVHDDPSYFAWFSRWGWLPLAVGTLVVCSVTVIVWDTAARSRGLDVSLELRTWFATRAFVVSALAAVWGGFFVHQTRKRIEQTRESLLEQRRRLEQTEGVAAILRVMAHELRNPLSCVRLHSDLIRRALASGSTGAALESLAELEADATRLASLVDEYVDLGRASSHALALTPIDLREPLRAAVEAQQKELASRTIRVDLDLPDRPVMVDGETSKLEVVVHKLLRNAAEAVGDGGGVLVRLCVDRRARLEVADSGPGFADPAIAFRPFYSTKSEHTGLGLSIVHDIVRAHRGDVSAFNRDEGGACVRVRIPIREEECSG